MSLIRNIVVKVGADISGLSSGMVSARRQLESNVDKMIGAAKILATATAAAFTAIAAKGIEAASDLNEIQNVVDVAFEKSAAKVDAWAKTAINAYGLNQIEALHYASTLRAMFGSMGLASDAADTMSKSLSSLAGDLASFYNLSTDDAFEKIQAGIAGETKPLKDLGINMDVANLQAFALSRGIHESFNAMSQAEQTTLRYNYLLSVTSMAQGDFARTSGSYANQMRVFQANMQSLTVSLGQAVIPLIQAALPWVNMFAQALIGAATAFAQWVDSLLGIKAQAAAITQSTGVGTDMADTTTGAAGANTNLAGTATKAAGGIDKVTKAAKAAKAAVSGIDELNILQKNDAGAGTSGAAAGSVGGAVGAGSPLNIPAIPKFAMQGKQNLNVGIIGADKIVAFKAALSGVWGWVVKYQDGIKAVASVIAVFFLPAIINSTAQLVIQAAKGFYSAIAAIVQYAIDGWAAVDCLLAQIGAIATNTAAWLAEKAAMLITAGAQKAVTAAQWLMNAAMEANPIGLVIAAVAALIAIFVALWNNNKDFRNFWTNAWKTMKNEWDLFSKGIQTIWNNILKPFGTFLWDLFCTRFSSIIDFVKGIIGNFKQVFNGLVEFFSGVFTGNWKKAFQGLKDIAGGIFSGIVNIVKLPLNMLIDGINTVLKGVNGIAKVAANVPGLSWLKGVNIPQIPKLANGGIVSSPTLAMIGEAGTEAVVPLQNTGFINTLAGAVASAVGGSGKPSGDMNITLEVDGVAFGKVCVKSINAQTRKLGVNPLYI